MKNEYSNYKEWKGWGSQGEIPTWLARYFQLEIARAAFPNFRTVLEIGFGNGEFLRWAQGQGVRVTGIEIIPELVEAARNQGVEAYHWGIASDPVDHSPLRGRQFDCIVAFDVMEHLTIEEIQKSLTRFSELLERDGRVVLRFPNGESPFSLPLQNGDHTHRTWLTKSKLEQMCLGSDLELVAYQNACRVANKARFSLFKSLMFKLRDIVEVVVGYLYYSKRIPLDANAVALLRKKKPI